MNALIVFCYIFSLLFLDSGGFRSITQKRAVITYYDPAYIGSAQAFTYRSRRGEPYRSNFTTVVLHPWANNVSVHISYMGKHQGFYEIINEKICDVLKIKWALAFFSKHLHRKLTCPLAPGIYKLYNLELPPKDFPFPLPTGEGLLTFKYLLGGKKTIYHCDIELYTPEE